MEFDQSQRNALEELSSGKILCGEVGSGKSRTALAYYFVKECGGSFEPSYSRMKSPKDLYIITTAKKRDTHEWEDELAPFLLTTNSELSIYNHKIVIDSWNNIHKYSNVKNSFFIFDEQRLVGSGAWVKSFYDISDAKTKDPSKLRNNHWLLLSATPGDVWSDYIPVFVANHFYKNKSEFLNRHAIYNRYSKFPKIDRYLEQKHLEHLRDKILVDIPIIKTTKRHYNNIIVDYDKVMFKNVMENKWDIFNNKPIKNRAQFGYILRKVVNMNDSRIDAVYDIYNEHKKLIIFYNFDYELEMLKAMCENSGILYAQWNGYKHQPLPEGDSWIYLVQYTSGSEGWNCITTDTIVFFSLNYSYRITMQSSGRIDRRNTPYVDLYYYFIKTTSWIDRAIYRALSQKKAFNESRHLSKLFAPK